MALARSSRQYMGVRAILPPDLVTISRAPFTITALQSDATTETGDLSTMDYVVMRDL